MFKYFFLFIEVEIHQCFKFTNNSILSECLVAAEPNAKTNLDDFNVLCTMCVGVSSALISVDHSIISLSFSLIYKYI